MLNRSILTFALAALASIAVSTAAHADQCQVIDRRVAANLHEVLHVSDWIVELCENCGEKQPGVPHKVQQIDLVPFDGGEDLEVILNGKGYDLAYTYVLTDSLTGQYTNLAHMAGCPSEGSSHEIHIPSPPAAQVEAIDAPLPAATPPAPAPPVVTKTVVIIETRNNTLAVLLGAGGSVLALGIALMVLRRMSKLRASQNLGRLSGE